MSLEQKKIKEAFKFALRDIHAEISEKKIGVRIKAIQFLLPVSHRLTGEIQRYTYCEKGTLDEYVKATKDFVFESDENEVEVKRSLYYSKFRDPFKYKSYGDTSWECVSNISFPTDEDFDFNSDQVPIKESDRVRLKNLNLDEVRKFWEEWNEVLKNKKYGYSSLWTYILIRKENIKEDDKNDEGFISSAFVVFDGCLESSTEEHKLQSITNKRVQDALYRLTLDLFNLEIYSQATRAAISQVMARNMSHNIGSHVLSKFKDKTDLQNFNSLAQYIGENYAYLYKNKELEKNEQFAYFNEYLKNRMDFLADIATSDPVMKNVMLLKNDIFKGFDRNRILLNRISGISDKDLKFKILLKKEGVELEEEDDIPLSMTNDILGCQAFYILLENVIRNVAKHSKAKDSEKQSIEITIDFDDFKYNKSFYEVSIYDNLKRKNSFINKVVVSRNNAFNDAVLNENNQLRYNNLGTIEMDVCAAYLRRLPLTSIEEDEYELLLYKNGKVKKGKVKKNKLPKPKLLFAYNHTHNKDKNEHSLGYKLYIGKPKEVLVIQDDSNDPFKVNNFTKDELFNNGIEIIRSSEISEHTIFNHQILYCHSPFNNELDASVYSSLPKRIVERIDNVIFDNPEEFIKAVWENYAVSNFLQGRSNLKIKNENIEILINGKNKKFEIQKDNVSDAETLLIDNHNKHWKDKDNYLYYDMACGHSKVKKYLGNITEDSLDEYDIPIKAQYLETAFCKILIIDERIQDSIVLNGNSKDKVYSGEGGDTPFYEYFKKQNVIIPDEEEANLNKLNFGTLKTKNSVAYNIKKFISNNTEKLDFCVMHLGVLEKMLNSADTKNSDKINSVLTQLFPNENSRRKLIITSGRGKPNNLPTDIPFVPLALIQNAIETVFDKFVLTRILYNSRRPI